MIDDDEFVVCLWEIRLCYLMSEGGWNIGCVVYLIVVIMVFLLFVFGMVKWIFEMGLIDSFIKYYDESLIDMFKDYLS